MSNNTQRVVKTIESIYRLRSSVNGNPRYRFTFTDGETLTGMSDAGWAYAVGNPDMREGCAVELELTRAGNIRTMSPAVEA